MIKFHNAKDTDGHIIHIEKVTKENRAEHYYCVGCGEEMSAVLGKKREHHFRHKEAHCSWESYLHKLGKILLKQRFDTQKEFIIKYFVEHHCDKYENCKLGPIFEGKKCNRREMIALDLKKYYDTCEEEVTYKGFRADLMLSSKEHPELPPIFLEISVSHDCEPEKLASGIHIIELKIADEKDVLRSLVEENNLFGNLNSMHPYDFDTLPPIRFFNFKRKFETFHPLRRFWVTKDESAILRGNCIQDDLTCRNVTNNHKEDSIYQIAIPSEVTMNNKRPNLFLYGLSKAIDAGIEVKHCCFCNKYQRCNLIFNVEKEDKKTGEKHLVQQKIKIAQIYPQSFDFFAQANECKYFSINRYSVYNILRQMRNLLHWEWKNSE